MKQSQLEETTTWKSRRNLTQAYLVNSTQKLRFSFIDVCLRPENERQVSGKTRDTKY